MAKKVAGHKTKELINLAVFQLMHKMEYDEITVKDICLKAGVSRMSFYRYYDKKDDVFIDYCDEKFARFFEEFESKEKPTLKSFIVAVFKYFRHNTRQLNILKQAKKETLLIAQFENYAKYILGKMEFSEYERKDSSVFAPFLAGGVYMILMHWLDEGCKKDEEDIVNSIFDIFEK